MQNIVVECYRNANHTTSTIHINNLFCHVQWPYSYTAIPSLDSLQCKTMTVLLLNIDCYTVSKSVYTLSTLVHMHSKAKLYSNLMKYPIMTYSSSLAGTASGCNELLIVFCDGCGSLLL